MNSRDLQRRLSVEERGARNLFIWGTMICSARLIWLTVDTHTTIPKRTNTDNLTDEVVLGKRIWHRYNCNDCHTILGIGAYYAPDLTKAYSNRGEVWLKAFLRDPESPDPKRRKMPNFNLTQNEIDRLVIFFKWVDAIDTNEWPPKPVTAPKPIAVIQKEMLQISLGKNIFHQNRCDLCHRTGDKGGTIGPELTHVGAKRDPIWLTAQIRDPKSHNPGTQMPPFPQIAEKDLHALVEYLVSLK